MAHVQKHALLGLMAAGLVLVRCASSSPATSASASGGTAVCGAGQRVPCGCADGSESARACKADGSGYFACICEAAAAGASGEGGAAAEAASGDGAAG